MPGPTGEAYEVAFEQPEENKIYECVLEKFAAAKPSEGNLATVNADEGSMGVVATEKAQTKERTLALTAVEAVGANNECRAEGSGRRHEEATSSSGTVASGITSQAVTCAGDELMLMRGCGPLKVKRRITGKTCSEHGE